MTKTYAFSLAIFLSAACAQGVGTPDDLNEPDTSAGVSRAHVLPLHPREVEAMRAMRAAAAKAKLVYYGGPVLQSVKVELIYWSDRAKVFGAGQLEQFYTDITNSAHFDWLNEYNTTSPTQRIGRGSFLGSAVASGGKVGSITDADIQAQITSLINSGKVDTSDFDNALYMVHFPPGTHITMGGSGSCSQFCAYHGTYSLNGHNVYYGVIPDQGADGCETGCGNGDHLQNTTSTTSHELIEAVTDPGVGLATGNAPPLAWYDNTNGEIGDICVTGTSYTGVVGNWTVQKEWSNQAGACIVTSGSTPPPPPPPPASDFGVSLSPSSATVAAGSSTTVTVATTTTGKAQSVTLSVSGLPAGVTGSFDSSTVQSGSSATLTLVADASAAGTSNRSFTVTGSAASGTHTASGSLTVTTSAPPPASDFAISLNPGALTVNAGASGTVTVSTSVVSGTPGNLSLSVAGLPAGVTGSFSRSTVTPGGSSILTVVAPSGAAASTSSLTITAADGNNSHAAQARLVVVPASPPPPPPPPAGDLITNGDFESLATGWQRGGNALITTKAFHDGSHSALVGTSGSTFYGDSYLYQGFTVPEGASTLQFWHLMRCRTPLGGGETAAYIVDSAGYILDTIYDTCDTDSDWTQETYDLSPLAGMDVNIYFYSFAPGFSALAAWQYIDGVSVTQK